MRSQLSAIVKMTLSTFTSRVGLRLLFVTDAIMIGRYSTEQLAWAGAANAIGGVLFVLAPGLLIGCLVSATTARASGNTRSVGPIWRAGVIYGTFAGVLCGLLCLAGPKILALLGQTPEVAAEGGRLMWWIGLSLPFHFAYFATLYALEAIGRAQAGAMVLILAVAINAGLNGLLIYDHAGGLGADGALLGTAAVRAGILAALIWLLFRGIDLAAHGLDRWSMPPRAIWRDLIRMGLAGGAALLGESSAFASLTVFAGWIGERALAVHTILFNVLSSIFTAALAVGVATSVEVAAARARREEGGPTRAAAAGLLVALALMGIFGMLAWLFADAVAGLFTTDAATSALAAALMGWLTLFLLADGAQVSMHHAVRGLGDAWPATAINLICYLGVMTTLAWALAIPGGQGVAGLFQGGLIASVLVVVLQLWRFRVLVRRDA